MCASCPTGSGHGGCAAEQYNEVAPVHERPSDRAQTTTSLIRGCVVHQAKSPLLDLRQFRRILDGLELLELDIVEFTADILDSPDVDVLDDVARVRIDRDHSSRALPSGTLHR